MLTTQLKEALCTMGKDGLMANEALALLQLSGSAAQAGIPKALSALFLRGEIAREYIGRGTGKVTHDRFRYFDKKALRERKQEARAEAKAVTERVAAKLNGGAVQAAIAEANKPEVQPVSRISAEGKRKAAKAAQAATAPVRVGKTAKKLPRTPVKLPKAVQHTKTWTIETPFATITITPKEAA